MKNIPDYSGFEDVPSSVEIMRLGDLIQDLEAAKAEQAQLEMELKQKTKEVVDIEQKQLPELMLALNLRKYETAGGLVLSLQETVRCSIPAGNRERCMQWLIDHNHAALIKDTVTVAFSARQHEAAMELKEKLASEHKHVTQDQKVEPSTMRAFIKSQLEEGVDFPMDMFGAFQQQKAVVKLKKAKKGF